MPTYFEKLKQSIPVVLGVAAFAGLIIAGDERYVHAGDLQSYQQSQKAEMQKMLNQMQKQSLENQLFALELKVNKTNIDLALIARYKRQMLDVIAPIE